MADYKEIKGFKWQSVSSDPSNPVLGQVWYNSTSPGTLKYRGFGTASWATGGTASDARYGLWASFGIQTAAVASGGADSPNEFFSATEEYNGSSWGSGGALPTALGSGGSLGTLTAGFGAGAYRFSPAARLSDGYEYDGSSWTSGGSLSTQRINSAGFGTQTAGIIFGGTTGSVSAVTQTYDGSSFTSNPANMNTARVSVKSGLNGSQTSTVAFGGNTGSAGTAATEDWNGTAWTNSTNLPAATQSHGGAGTGAAGLSFMGQAPGDTAATYEYSEAAAETKSITVS